MYLLPNIIKDKNTIRENLRKKINRFSGQPRFTIKNIQIRMRGSGEWSMVENTMNEVNMVNLGLMDEEIFYKRLSGEHRKLYSIAFSYLRTEEDALEVVQEASCRAWIAQKAQGRVGLHTLADPDYHQLLHGRAPAQKARVSGGAAGGAKSGDNTKKLYYPSIISSKNSEVYSDGSHFTLVFKNSQFDQLDSTSLKIAGIAALEKDQMKIVVDINKKQIIEAPGTDLKIIQPDQQLGAREILFQREIEKAQSLNSIMMWLADSFTDAKGQKHKMSLEEDSSRRSRTSKDDTAVDEYSFNFGEEAVDYPQPLTLTIEQYWNPIMD